MRRFGGESKLAERDERLAGSPFSLGAVLCARCGEAIVGLRIEQLAGLPQVRVVIDRAAVARG